MGDDTIVRELPVKVGETVAMVGLFWIAGDVVHLGAPPSKAGPGVVLTADGLGAVGQADGRGWAWEDIRSLAIRDAPVKPPAARACLEFLRAGRRDAARELQTGPRASLMVGSALTSVLSPAANPAQGAVVGPGGPALLSVHLETAEGPRRLGVHAAVAGGYVRSEYELSQALLDRFVDGTASPAVLMAWHRDREDSGTPRRAAREALLRAWGRE